MSDTVRRFVGLAREMGGHLLGLEEPVAIVSSDDADGLSAAFLTTLLMEEGGREYGVVVVDKAYPELVKSIGKLYSSAVFLDLGGPFYKYWGEEELERYVVVDDHMEAIKPPQGLAYLNPHREGVREPTPSSVMAYLMALDHVKNIRRYAWAALLGLGESGAIPTGYLGLVLTHAVSAGVVEKRGKSLRLRIHDVVREYKSLYKDLTLVSTMGYFDEAGLDIIASMKFGGMRDVLSRVEGYRERRKKLFDEMFSLMDTGEMVFHGRSVQWVEDYKGLFYNYSPRVFDTYMSTLSMYARYFDPRKYILGITNRNPYIPGYGMLSSDWASIPIRTSRKLAFRIRVGSAQPVFALAEASAFPLGGLGYGYDVIGSVVVEASRVREFIRLFDDLAGAR